MSFLRNVRVAGWLPSKGGIYMYRICSFEYSPGIVHVPRCYTFVVLFQCS